MYLLIGIIWVVCCLSIGFYIRGKFLFGQKQYRLGLKALFLFYLFGLFFLFFAIIYS